MMARLTKRLASITALAAAATMLLASPAAASVGPVWRVTAQADTTVAPGASFVYRVETTNVGDGSADAGVEPFTLTVALPAGLQATAVTTPDSTMPGWDCSATIFPSSTVTCTNTTDVAPATQVDPTEANGLFEIAVTAEAAIAPGTIRTASFHLEGGGAVPANTIDPITVTPALPGFGIAAFDGGVSRADGSAYTAAAGHPYQMSTTIDFNTRHNPAPLLGDLWPEAPAKDVLVDLPPGLIGNPTGIAQCTAGDLANARSLSAEPLCPSTSQIGTTVVRLNGHNVTRDLLGPIPLFNLVPPPGIPARFGFNVLGTVVIIDARLRSDSDYGISADVKNISEGIPLAGTTLHFWDVPSDSSHDAERACPGQSAPWSAGPSCQSGAPPRAFWRNPTSCTSPGQGVITTAHADSWAHPGDFVERSFASHEAPGYPANPNDPETPWGAQVGITGCEKVPFTPTIAVRPTTQAADSPTGLNVDLTMPQEALKIPGAIAQADLKDSVVTQPVGTRVNPAAAGGLTGCSEAQIGLIGTGFPAPNSTHFNTADPTCPDSSKIGTVEIVTPLQEEPMHGAIYQAEQGENPFGSTLAFYAVAKGQGLIIKLPAEVRTDPVTGQVSTIFRDSPQLPFEHYRLHFDAGNRAPLITPPTCGAKTTESDFTSWANPGVHVQTTDTFKITSGPNGSACPTSEAARPFNPSFTAGTVNPIAGAFSPFVLKLGREDGTQELTGLDTTLPPGLIGRLAGVPYCSDAAIEAARANSGRAEQTSPSCPAASRVGTADATAGAGPEPFHNPGIAYLAGPYKGAPLSLAIVTPAVAGPLDLGTVVVRSALYVDPTTTQIHVVTDPIPTRIVVNHGGEEDGFPLDLRSVVVNMDRPDFTLNPTSCNPMAVSGVVGGTNSASANVTNRFQVGNCSSLAFQPKLNLRLKGKTNRGAHPALRAVLTMPATNQANIARAQVTLPHAEFLDQGHIRNVCTRTQFAAAGCPKSSVLGYARAFSPLLEQPLQGPVYLMSGFGHKLPDLAADLNGQIRVLLHGKIDTGPGGGIRNTFTVVPDAPVTKFTLSLKGGSKGLIQNSENICSKPQHALALFDAQNGKIRDLNPLIRTDCGAKAKNHHGKRHH